MALLEAGTTTITCKKVGILTSYSGVATYVCIILLLSIECSKCLTNNYANHQVVIIYGRCKDHRRHLPAFLSTLALLFCYCYLLFPSCWNKMVRASIQYLGSSNHKLVTKNTLLDHRLRLPHRSPDNAFWHWFDLVTLLKFATGTETIGFFLVTNWADKLGTKKC